MLVGAVIFIAADILFSRDSDAQDFAQDQRWDKNE